MFQATVLKSGDILGDAKFKYSTSKIMPARQKNTGT